MLPSPKSHRQSRSILKSKGQRTENNRRTREIERVGKQEPSDNTECIQGDTAMNGM